MCVNIPNVWRRKISFRFHNIYFASLWFMLCLCYVLKSYEIPRISVIKMFCLFDCVFLFIDWRWFDSPFKYGRCQIFVPRTRSLLSASLDVPGGIAEETCWPQLGSQRYVELCHLLMGIGNAWNPICRSVADGVRYADCMRGPTFRNSARHCPISSQDDSYLHEWRSWQTTSIWYDCANFGKNETLSARATFLFSFKVLMKL